MDAYLVPTNSQRYVRTYGSRSAEVSVLRSRARTSRRYNRPASTDIGHNSPHYIFVEHILATTHNSANLQHHANKNPFKKGSSPSCKESSSKKEINKSQETSSFPRYNYCGAGGKEMRS